MSEKYDVRNYKSCEKDSLGMHSNQKLSENKPNELAQVLQGTLLIRDTVLHNM